MRLFGLLSFFDEPASWLAACITAAGAAGVTDMVVVDGRYFLYPEQRDRSGMETHHVITACCHAQNMSLSLHIPSGPWMGNEVQKRSFMFRLAETLSEPDDWYWVFDADVIVEKPVDIKPDLAATDLDVAEVLVHERQDPNRKKVTAELARGSTWAPSTYKTRCLFRAVRGLTLRTNHYTYVTPDGRKLHGDANGQPLEPALDLAHVSVDHLTRFRDHWRHENQYAYYQRRDSYKVERGPCQWREGCDEQAEQWVQVEWELDPAGLSAKNAEMCAKHAKRQKHDNRYRLLELGYNPDQQLARVAQVPA